MGCMYVVGSTVLGEDVTWKAFGLKTPALARVTIGWRFVDTVCWVEEATFKGEIGKTVWSDGVVSFWWIVENWISWFDLLLLVFGEL